MLGSNQLATPKVHQMRITQSVNGICIPIAWGTCRISALLLWYGDLTGTKVSPGGGSGLGKDGSQYDYHAAVLGALCRGVVTAIGGIWSQNGKLTLQSASEAFVVPGGGGSYTVANAALFSGDTGAA